MLTQGTWLFDGKFNNIFFSPQISKIMDGKKKKQQKATKQKSTQRKKKNFQTQWINSELLHCSNLM